MKKLLPVCSFLFASWCNGQTHTPAQFLIASFQLKYDKPNEHYYYELLPQKGLDTANEVYQLINYNNRKNAENTLAGFFYNSANGTGVNNRLYNYFISHTEGLNYLLSRGWKVVGVYTEVSSGEKSTGLTTENNIITTVSSKPVFCLQK